MDKKSFLVIFFMMLMTGAEAQYKLAFCEEVKNNKCKGPGNEFLIDDKGGVLALMFSADSGKILNMTSVTYKVFTLDKNNQEYPEKSFVQKTDSTWTTAWKDLTFMKPGHLKVKAYNSKGDFLCETELKITKE